MKSLCLSREQKCFRFEIILYSMQQPNVWRPIFFSNHLQHNSRAIYRVLCVRENARARLKIITTIELWNWNRSFVSLQAYRHSLFHSNTDKTNTEVDSFPNELLIFLFCFLTILFAFLRAKNTILFFFSCDLWLGGIAHRICVCKKAISVDELYYPDWENLFS